MTPEQIAQLPPGPWRLAPLKGKYYGTRILDADGNGVCEVWLPGDEPSIRERANERPGEDYSDYYCDGHYETVRDYAVASLIVEAREKV